MDAKTWLPINDILSALTFKIQKLSLIQARLNVCSRFKHNVCIWRDDRGIIHENHSVIMSMTPMAIDSPIGTNGAVRPSNGVPANATAKLSEVISLYRPTKVSEEIF